MSVVWLAYDPELDRRVALKLMHRVASDHSFGDSDQRLLREAQALARLSHVNVVHVYDVGVVAGQVYIAMELVDGLTLREWIAEGTHGWREIMTVLLRSGRGLAAAHAAGLVHLDFKPSNVLVAPSEGAGEIQVRVVDFGLAREPASVVPRPSDEAALSRSGRRLGERLTEDGAVLGTPGYIAPEVLCGRQADPRADQFSFCVTAWEALFGDRPFAGEDHTTLHKNVLAGRVRDPPPRVPVPRATRRALLRGLAVSPEHRFSSMHALLDAIAPKSRARPIVWLGLGAVAIASLALPLLQPAASTIDHCAAVETSMDAAWNPEVAARTRAAFDATGTPYAAAAWSSATKLLDAWADHWTTDARDACEATLVRAEQSQETYDLRRACFDEARAQLEAVVEVFVAADATVVEHAVQAVVGLPSPGRCSDLDALRDEASAPRDPVARERAVEIDREVLRVRALMDAGRMAEAARVGQEALAHARELDHAPTLSRALLGAANARVAIGENLEAIPMLDEALWLAERSGLDRLRLRVLIDQVYVVGHIARDRVRGRWYADLASAVQQRIDGRGTLFWQLMVNRGVLAADAGEQEEALALLEQALAASERDDSGFDGTNRSTLLMNIGSSHYERGDYHTALDYYQRALDMQVEQLGDAHPQVATAFENRANAEQALGQLDDALADHMRALAIHERIGLLSGSSHAVLLNNIGVVLSGMHRWDEAVKYYDRARRLLEPDETDHPLYPITLSNTAEAELAQGHAKEALALYRDARERLARILGAEHPYVAVASTGLGHALIEVGEYEEARVHLLHSLEIQRQGADPAALAETRFGLARVIAATGGDAAEARRLAEQAREALLLVGQRGALPLARVEAFLKD
jgi:tetratricopeptide (TPR) repeat protein/tRNA A-37 threonylcarbamoyl transferase component Bud32